MKWMAILALGAGAAYLFLTRKGKQIREELSGLAKEGGELKHYMGNIVSDIKEQKLQYGEQAAPTASRH
jgi:hypothetical protein